MARQRTARYEPAAHEPGRSLAHMKDPEKWHRWPRLPLKNDKLLAKGEDRIRGVEVPAHARLHNRVLGCLVEELSISVYLCTMFDKIYDHTPKLTYPSLEAVVDDGWLVD